VARFREKVDLVTIGAYQRGGDRELDYAIDKLPAIDLFLRQAIDELAIPAEEADAILAGLMSDRPSPLPVLASGARTDDAIVAEWPSRP
jgi:flagellum-specific ATP synthase